MEGDSVVPLPGTVPSAPPEGNVTPTATATASVPISAVTCPVMITLMDAEEILAHHARDARVQLCEELAALRQTLRQDLAELSKQLRREIPPVARPKPPCSEPGVRNMNMQPTTASGSESSALKRWCAGGIGSAISGRKSNSASFIKKRLTYRADCAVCEFSPQAQATGIWETTSNDDEDVPENTFHTPKLESKAFNSAWMKASFLFEESQFTSMRAATARSIVSSKAYEWIMSVFIVLSAVNIGVQTQHAAVNPGTRQPLPLIIFDIIFCMITVADVILRLHVFRGEYFHNAARFWNIFDLVLAVTIFVEELVYVLDWINDDITLGSRAQIMRMLRLWRAVRLFRIMGLRSLRKLLQTIAASLVEVAWAGILLFIWVYAFGIILTTAILNYSQSDSRDQGSTGELKYWFGTLDRTVLSLFQAVTGGADWKEMSDPIFGRVSTALGISFVFFVFFLTFVIMHVVAGFFVDNTIRQGVAMVEREKEAFAQQLCDQLDMNNSGAISLEEFTNQQHTEAMQRFLKTNEIEPGEAAKFFELIAGSDSRSIQMSDFNNAYLRMQREPKRVDLLVMQLGLVEVLETLGEIHEAVMTSVGWTPE
eukprot:NODE_2363_length_2228_cov_10.716802.p1 GENE.NODE_2363_length_2228_cov_10.716802~~NODE_2363_length_2228_cov_10.716802.p1  ORF type:complete len:597 (+),score=140.32 NODE_2363_length_2228_cov_10.716802:142-1932(+)